MTTSVTKPATTPSKFLSKADIPAAIKSITARGAKLDGDIQHVAISALHHLATSGDIMAVNALFLGMPKGSRKAALTAWYLTHGALIATTGPDKGVKPFAYTKDKKTNVEAGMADPWFNHSPDKKPDEVFDLQAAIAAIIKKASGKGRELAHGELLIPLQGLLNMERALSPSESAESVTTQTEGDESGDGVQSAPTGLPFPMASLSASPTELASH